MPYVKAADFERLQAAEEACFSTLIAIGLGVMDGAELDGREVVAEGGLLKWAHLATGQGMLRDEDEDEC